MVGGAFHEKKSLAAGISCTHTHTLTHTHSHTHTHTHTTHTHTHTLPLTHTHQASAAAEVEGSAQSTRSVKQKADWPFHEKKSLAAGISCAGRRVVSALYQARLV